MKQDDAIKAARRDYGRGVLEEGQLAADPLVQFRSWFDYAMASDLREPNACALATVGATGQPAVRMVLLKGIDERGLLFFTNYGSRKGDDIQGNPRVALLFFWAEFERQIRVEGHVERLTSTESDAYFAQRPRAAQLGAIVSRQSRVVGTRREIDEAVDQLRRCVGEDGLVRPAEWGGYRVLPERYEFWQGRENRLHDRIVYLPTTSGWRMERLWP
jgi:pyridoxamine 5'-phosphate oxidase